MGRSGDVKACELCSGLSETLVTVPRKVNGGLWSYLYHGNVRETLIPSTTTGVTGEEGGDDGAKATRLPKFTFTLALAGSTAGSLNEVLMCQDCSNEVEKLTQLDRQLENVKKAIDTQVARINQIRKRCENGGGKTISGFTCSDTDVSMGGSVIGTGNISLALQFLDNLCKGMTAPSSRTEFSCPSSSELSPNNPSANAFMNSAHVGDDTAVYLPNCKDEPVITITNPNDFVRVSGSQDTPSRFQKKEESSASSFPPLEKNQFRQDVVGHEFLGTIPQEYSNPTAILPSSSLSSIPNLDSIETEPVILKQEFHFTPGESGQASLVSEDLAESSSTSYISEGLPFIPDPLATSDQFQVSNDTADPDWSPISAKSSRNTTSQKKRPGQKVKRRRTKKECNVCGKVFGIGDLSRHMRVHTGARPFHCDICFKTFASRWDVTRHNKRNKNCIPATDRRPPERF